MTRLSREDLALAKTSVEGPDGGYGDECPHDHFGCESCEATTFGSPCVVLRRSETWTYRPDMSGEPTARRARRRLL